MRSINEIIVHCSATPEGKDFTVADITRWHKARGFRTIGYHYVIYRDGSIHPGRPEEQVGAHCRENGHNRHSIGICYIGGCAGDGTTPKDTRTQEQKAALRVLLRHLRMKYPNASIHGHNEFARKACPCFNVLEEYKHLALFFILVTSALLMAGCRTSKRVVEEKADCTELLSASQSATSSAADMFMQDMVLKIDSIVVSNLSVPQMSLAEDVRDIGPAGGNSGEKADDGTKAVVPRRSPGTKVVIKGIQLQSSTAGSSLKESVVADSLYHQASKNSLVKVKEVKKQHGGQRVLFFLLLATIAVMGIIAMVKRGNPIRAIVGFILRMVKA